MLPVTRAPHWSNIIYIVEFDNETVFTVLQNTGYPWHVRLIFQDIKAIS